MDWKEKLLQIESSFGFHKKQDWKPAIELVQKIVTEDPNNIEVSVRAIYLLHNILVEEEYPKEEHDLMAGLLKKYFDESYEKFSENPEYLFFIGKLLYIAEWYFGIDDDTKPIEKRLAFNMQKKAFEKEPENLLYEWALVFSKNERKRAFDLSKQLLFTDIDKLNWLKTKGFAGKYLTESIEYCFENYNQIV